MMTNDSNLCQTTNSNAGRTDRCRMARPAAFIMAVLLLLSTGCGRSREAADAEDPLADAWQALQVNARYFPESLYTVMREAWDARHEAERRTLRPAEPMQGVAMWMHDDEWQTVAGRQVLKCGYNLFSVDVRRQDVGIHQRHPNFSAFDEDGRLLFSLDASASQDGDNVQKHAYIIWRIGDQLRVAALLPEFVPDVVAPLQVEEYIPHVRTLLTLPGNDAFSFNSYDHDTRRLDPVRLIVKKTPEGFRVTQKYEVSKLEVHSLYDHDFRILEFSGVGLRFVLADAAESERELASPEGIVSIEAPLDCWLPAGTEVEALELRLHFVRDSRLPRTARQSVEPDEEAKSLVVRVKSEIPPAEGTSEIMISDETSIYIEPDRMHQSDHPEIVRMANTIVDGISDPVDRCKALAEWIRTNIAYTLEVAMGDAVQTLETRRGDCSEYATLFIAFARALGIPAREASGWMVGEASVTGHAWCEVHLGDRWYEVDPGKERLWIGARYISQLRNHFYTLESAELVSWTAHGKRIVPDKTRPLWTLRNGIYHNRIYGISVSVPDNALFFVDSDGALRPNVREGRAVPGDINSSLFTLSQPLKEMGINEVYSFSLLEPETCQQSFVSELGGLGGAVHGMVLVDARQIDSEIGKIVVGRTSEHAIIYLLPPRKTGSYHIMVAYLKVGADGILPIDDPFQLPGSVLDLWRSVEMGTPDIE